MKSLRLSTLLGIPILVGVILINGCEIIRNYENKNKKITFEKIMDLQKLRESQSQEEICLPDKRYLPTKARTIINNYGCNFKSLVTEDIVAYLNEINPSVKYSNGETCIVAPKYKDCLLNKEVI